MTQRTVRVLALLLLAAIGCGATRAQETRQPSAAEPTQSYVPGELIVKLKPEAGKALAATLQAGRPPTQTGLAWFDALNQRYGVRQLAPLFPDQRDIEDIRRKYPERARRAPPNATAPSLQYIYKLTMPQDADILQAAADYAKQPDVEYAQPNYLATTSSPGALSF